MFHIYALAADKIDLTQLCGWARNNVVPLEQETDCPATTSGQHKIRLAKSFNWLHLPATFAAESFCKEYEMGYQHYMDVYAKAKPNVAKTQIIQALEPLNTYFGWNYDHLLRDQTLEDGEHTINWWHQPPSNALMMHPHTAADVSYSYDDLVRP